MHVNIRSSVTPQPTRLHSIHSELQARLTAMSKALSATKNKEVRESADGYVDAVKEIEVRAKKMDAADVRVAFTALSKSCTDCHHKGGPGGKLDD